MNKLYYKEYYKLEREHWWFKARLNILDSLMQTDISKNGISKILNAGAATGATSVMLKKYGQVVSLEYDKDCSEFLSEVLGEDILNDSLTDLPMDDKSLDLVCAFDVIEHIKDHQQAVKEGYRVLKDNGYIFLTVPAFQILWSKHDEINHHYRRYRLKELRKILLDNGFEIEYSSYFNFLLFLPISFIRLLSKLLLPKESGESTGSDFEKFNSSNFLNRILYKVFMSERALLKRKIKLPFGVSAIIIGKKVV
ncbi:MAG: class I SAM-dependent methyltransferase [Flexibacter sp. CG_4_10_14_3_um_filter_32_15]|nr:MAG: class I SAM-dependent methyltransferase [Flexibacter sp. CG_4_10_14_3_um_filter_32_15]